MFSLLSRPTSMMSRGPAQLMQGITGIPARHASAALALAHRCELPNFAHHLVDGPLRLLAMRNLDEVCRNT